MVEQCKERLIEARKELARDRKCLCKADLYDRNKKGFQIETTFNSSNCFPYFFRILRTNINEVSFETYSEYYETPNSKLSE